MLYIFRVVSRAYLWICYYDILSYSSIFVNDTVPTEMWKVSKKREEVMVKIVSIIIHTWFWYFLLFLSEPFLQLRVLPLLHRFHRNQHQASPYPAKKCNAPEVIELDGRTPKKNTKFIFYHKYYYISAEPKNWMLTYKFETWCTIGTKYVYIAMFITICIVIFYNFLKRYG